MSTGKRLAKRSIIGTRVCAPGNDGKYYSGVIHAVKTPASATAESGLRITPKTRYSVRFDSLLNGGRPPSPSTEYSDRDLIGPGFGSVTSARLVAGQKVYLTYNGREINAEVTQHREHLDEVDVIIAPNGQEGTMRLTKRIDEVRLLESRKSARLADQDTDFARLADMAGDRKRASSHSIDVPHVPGSRKRRPSSSNDSERSYNGWPLENYARIGHRCGREGCRTNERGDCMDECTAALVLMSLSCSPHSPHHSLPLNCPNGSWMGQGGDNAVMGSPGNGGTSNSSSSDVSWRSGTPSPQLSEEGAPVATSTWPTSNNPNVGVRSVANNNNININNNNSDHCNASTSHHQLNSSYNVSGSSPGSTPNSSGTFDEGIVTDYLEEMHPKKKKRELQNQTRANHHLMENDVGYNFERSIPAVTTLVFKCTWPGCTEIKTTCPLIEEHVRQSHLGPKKTKAQSDDDDCDMSDHEEEFYYQEIAVNHMSSPPTMSHRDMARPPHEDPEYQKQLRLESSSAITTTATTTTTPANSEIVSLNSSTVGGASSAIINNKERLFNFKVSPIRPRSPATPIKHMKHSSRHNHQAISMLAVTTAIGKIASSPRRVRGDTKKCRKIYGMENREQWCTQCKWKKACVRFAE